MSDNQCDYVHEGVVRCVFGAGHTVDYHLCGDKRVYTDGRVTGLGYTAESDPFMPERRDET